VYTTPAALAKTAQQSGNSTGKIAFHHSTFSKVFRRLQHLPMKEQTFEVFYYLPLTCFTTFFLF